VTADDLTNSNPFFSMKTQPPPLKGAITEAIGGIVDRVPRKYCDFFQNWVSQLWTILTNT
jgi:hypothetical protein